MDKKKNLENHLSVIQAEVDSVTLMFTDSEHLSYKSMIELNNKYANAANVGQFIASMLNGLFPAQIVTPQPSKLQLIN